MSAPPAAEIDRTRKRNILALRVCLFTICALGVLATWAIGWSVRTEKEERHYRALVEQQFAELRAAGQPVTAEDLARLYPDPPPEQDAGRILAESGLILVESHSTNWPFSLSNPSKPNEALDPQIIESIRQFIAANRWALEHAPVGRLAGTRCANGFPSALTNGPPRQFKDVQQLAWFFLVQSALCTEEGRAEEALSGLDSGLVLSRTAQGPHSAMVISRCLRSEMACRIIERLLNRSALSNAQLVGLEAWLQPFERVDVEAVLALRRCYAVHEFEALGETLKQKWPAGMRLPPTARWLVIQYPLKKSCSSKDLLRFLTETERRLRALTPPIAAKMRSLRESERSRDRQEHGGLLPLLEAAISSGSIRGYPSFGGLVALTRTALAIERWRLDHDDQPPDALAELVPQYLPAVPQDPFDGQEMRYRRMRKGYFVYCVGMDGKDHAGRRLPSLYTEKEGYDITFLVER